MAEKKRHHYLPETYLAGFTDDGTREGRFYVYSRRSNSVVAQTPINTGVIGHWYRVRLEDGSTNSYLEDWLSKLETRAAPTIAKLRRGGEPLSATERFSVAQFLAFLWTRGPDFHNQMEDMDQVMLEHGERFAALNPQPPPHIEPEPLVKRPSITLDELRREAPNGRVRLPREKVIPTMLFLSEGITKFIFAADWMLYRAPEGTSFITTDCPVIAVPEVLPERPFYPRAPLDFDVPKIVPISSETLLAFSGKDGGHGEKVTGRSQVRAYNVLLATRADDYVIARDEPHVKSIASRAHLSERGEKERIFPPPERKSSSK